MKKQLIISSIHLLFFFIVSAQENEALPDLTPPSPTAYELGKYGQIPVNLFSGTINSNIPIFTFETSNLSIPLSLNYYSNGIKVDQMPTNVGLGWVLNAGGVITRVVKGEPDEDRLSSIPQEIIENGIDVSNDNTYNFLKRRSLDSLSYHVPDSEMDIFSFNFLGHMGQFVFSHNQLMYNTDPEIVLLEPNGLDIKKEGNSFIITDKDGIKYYFAEVEYSFTKGQKNDQSIDYEYPTGWYLNKVVHPLGDEVYLNYSNKSYSYWIGLHQSLSVPTASKYPCPVDLKEMYYSWSEVTRTLGVVRGKQLMSISSNKPQRGEVFFDYETFTLEPTMSFPIVSHIRYMRNDGTVRDRADFNYLITAHNRLFLQEISFKDISKKYSLEYINPEEFPERLSFSQDHWGYFNGVNNSYFFPNPKSSQNNVSLHESFDQVNVGANKKPNPYYAKTGLLNKIIYPTKGSTEISYEGNTFSTTKTTTGPTEGEQVIVKEYTDSYTLGSSKEVEIGVKYGQEVRFFGNVAKYLGDSECATVNEDDPDKIMITVSIENLAGGRVSFYYYSDSGKVYLDNSVNITRDSSIKDFYAYLSKDNNYRITLSPRHFCTDASLVFYYYKGDLITTTTPVEITEGGLRVSQITNTSALGKRETKRYFYSKKEDMEKSSGIKGLDPWYITKNTNRINISEVHKNPGFAYLYCNDCDNVSLTLNSSSVRNLYPSSKYPSTTYTHVIESYGEGVFEHGGTEHEFYVGRDYPAVHLYGDIIPYSTWDNRGWINGLKKKISHFKYINENIIVTKEKENIYTRDTHYNQTIYGLTIRKKYNYLYNPTNGDVCGDSQEDGYRAARISNLDIALNKLQTNWYYLSSSTDRLFDKNGENPIEIVNSYFYDNPEHLQLTRTILKNSKGNVLITKTLYPQDISNRTSAENKLITQHRIAEPIQFETYQDGVKLSSVRNVFGDTWGNNQVLLKEIHTSKKIASPEPRIQYHKYDNYGNPLELSLVNGPHIVYLWGYNGQYPIAKIENVPSYNTISSTLITAARNASNSGTEADLIGALDDLRDALPDSRVTTYTYKPWIGISTITDSRGEKMTYTYDTFNRLRFIKDEADKLLEEYQYHYKNQ
ncbi:hypothetical protein [Sinomicrobium sp. M5D2P9]